MVHLFKEGFTPLFKVSISNEVFKQDLLDIKYCHACRGPKGHCFSRSKLFTHYFGCGDETYFDIRVIFNREKLAQRYKIYPVDEFFLSKTKDAKKGWFNKHSKSVHKAAFPLYKNSDGEILRQPRHNLKGIDFKKCSIEFEYEERILTSVPNLGRYIYAINFRKDNYIHLNGTIKKYLEKYPHIKILIGHDKLEDKTDYFKEKNSVNSTLDFRDNLFA